MQSNFSMPLMKDNIGNFTGYVNQKSGDVTGCGKYRAGYSTGMDLKGILERIERRLIAVDKKADKASNEAGKPDAIRNLRRAVESKKGGITVATLEALAPVLETTVVYLLKGEGPESLAHNNRFALIRAAFNLSPAKLGLSEADWHDLEISSDIEPHIVLGLHDLTRLPLSFIRTGQTDELSPEDARKLLSAALPEQISKGTSPASRRVQNRADLKAKSR